MSEKSRARERLFKAYFDEMRAALTPTIIDSLKENLPAEASVDVDGIANRLTWCLILQRQGGKAHHLNRQKNQELSLEKLDTAKKALRKAQKALELLLRTQVDDIPWVVESMEHYYFALTDESKATNDQKRTLLGGNEGILELIIKTRADLERLICLCEVAESGLNSIPKHSDSKLDIEGRSIFRCAAISWVACTAKLPPIGTQGPFHRFLETLRQTLPEDCRPKPCSGETVRRWLKEFSRRGGLSRSAI